MKSFIIGISDRTVRFLELNEKREISYLEQTDISFSFSECFSLGMYDDSVIQEASEVINKFVRELNFTSSKIGVLLDSSYAFINKIPMDFDDTQENIISGILWDLSNYFPDSYKDFKINFYKLKDRLYSERIKNTLIIAVENKKLDILKKILNNCGHRIHCFDIDHFGADKYVRMMNLGGKPGNIMNIGCKRNRIDMSIIDSDGEVYFDYLIFRDTGYQKKLKSFLSLPCEVNSNLKFTSVNVYGDDYSDDVSKSISEMFPTVKVERADIFRKFLTSSRVRNNERYLDEGNKFIPLAGLALTTLSK